MLCSPVAGLLVMAIVFTYLKYAALQKIVELAVKAIATKDDSASLPGVQFTSNRDRRRAVRRTAQVRAACGASRRNHQGAEVLAQAARRASSPCPTDQRSSFVFP